MEEHPSIPFNPDIATAFFRAGLIEAWGRGSLKIVRERKEARLPAPIFTYDLSGFRIEFKKEAGKSSDEIRCSIFPFPALSYQTQPNPRQKTKAFRLGLLGTSSLYHQTAQNATTRYKKGYHEMLRNRPRFLPNVAHRTVRCKIAKRIQPSRC